MKKEAGATGRASEVTLRPANPDDRKLLWEWANDPEVRAVSFHSDPIPWEDHVRWFDGKLGNADCVLYIAANEQGRAIGQVRFDLDSQKATVSISLDRDFRGRGVGAQVLNAACREFLALRRRASIHAWIKAGNQASLRAFRKVGFAEYARETIDGGPAMHLVLEEKDLPPMNALVINGRPIGAGYPVLIIAELSANHGGSYDKAVELIHAAHQAGADAIKLQTYTPDTITLESDRPEFRVGGGTLWDGRTLYDLYREAYTPWEWQPKLKALADHLGMELFSSAFDPTAVDFLEQMGVAVHKIASFELVDIPLIRKMASTGKPMIISTGMGSMEEIEEAVAAARDAGCRGLALLKCTSAYPAPPEEMDLRAIPALAERFGVPVGLSDHTMGIAVPVAAVALGACLIEKHFTLRRAEGGPDSAFSLEPEEFRAMVHAVRVAEKALGRAQAGWRVAEDKSRAFRRSLFVVADVKQGEKFSEANVRSIRPASGLHPRHLPEVLGKRAASDISRGTPLSWELVAGGAPATAARSKVGE